jgi:Mg-chelatase subunit ChlD
MKKQVLLVSILDQSGSMSDLTAQTIEGYNSFLRNQKWKEIMKITTVMFNDTIQVIHRDVSVENALIDRLSYHPDGSTALYDATGKTLLELMDKVKHSEQKYHVYVVIVTDGEENASQFFTLPMVRQLITQARKIHEFEFVFLGANFDVKEVGQSLNLPKESIKEFRATNEGVKDMFNDLAESINFATDSRISNNQKRRNKKS